MSVRSSPRESTRGGRRVRGVKATGTISTRALAALRGVIVATGTRAGRFTDRLTTRLIGTGRRPTGGRRSRRFFSGGGIGVGVLFFCSAGSVGDVGDDVVTGRRDRIGCDSRSGVATGVGTTSRVEIRFVNHFGFINLVSKKKIK
uniref:Uncharacterized protein n=1 Tax=Cacopsylla melanoneura TaxID=428564 RepID=A0A8D8ZSF0_9HEMI